MPHPIGNRPFLKKTALVSIHDVMSDNLLKIHRIVGFLRRAGVRPITLLIVPGRGWQDRDVDRLKALQADPDIEFAGHGWRHGINGFGSLRHRLHGLLISRREAEHLPLSAEEISGLIRRNHDWFLKVGLNPPDLYVPPAWAMGKIPKKGLHKLPFRYYETLAGIYDAGTGERHPMAVCGYMADTRFRCHALRIANVVNRRLLPFPLRIAIHPDDLDLMLASDLSACLEKDFSFSTCRAFFCR